MKWVKASERLPETNDTNYFIRHTGDGKLLAFFNGKRFEVGDWINKESIQWLDESPIKEDGEDELWEEMENELANWDGDDDASLQDFINKQKSKFHITRKQ